MGKTCDTALITTAGEAGAIVLRRGLFKGRPAGAPAVGNRRRTVVRERWRERERAAAALATTPPQRREGNATLSFLSRRISWWWCVGVLYSAGGLIREGGRRTVHSPLTQWRLSLPAVSWNRSPTPLFPDPFSAHANLRLGSGVMHEGTHLPSLIFSLSLSLSLLSLSLSGLTSE
ncbi:hypothetical protein CEXT_98221 [Caerostris extrusa]|uniref:Uncharacterized protein n=1 Tax=Caerostris extrusa TaxID=172846 RepID=A0AAV4W189_CAEEX|nr:hypothetical protein CEXT_98221 [Caerostris extrusa]